MLRTLAIMAGITNMVAFGIISIFVLFIQDIVGLGDVGFGLMLSVMGVGGLTGALLAPRVVAKIGRARTLLTSVLMLGICTSRRKRSTSESSACASTASPSVAVTSRWPAVATP